MSPGDRADRHPLELNLVGVQIAQLAIGVLGVLVITAEYSTGMIRASLSAVPKRLPVLIGKAGVYAVTTLVLMVPAALIAFFIGQAILSGGGLPHLGFGELEHRGVPVPPAGWTVTSGSPYGPANGARAGARPRARGVPVRPGSAPAAAP